MSDKKYNKVVFADGTTVIDLTEDTVTADTLLNGTTAHDKTGNIITGTAVVLDEWDGSYTIATEGE